MLLFTFAIGNVWAAVVTADKFYWANNTVYPVSTSTGYWVDEINLVPTTAWGTTNPTTSNRLKVYAGKGLTISTATGKKITKIEIAWYSSINASKITANEGSISNDATNKKSTWTGEETSVTINNTNSSDYNFSQIKVTYSEDDVPFASLSSVTMSGFYRTSYAVDNIYAMSCTKNQVAPGVAFKGNFNSTLKLANTTGTCTLYSPRPIASAVFTWKDGSTTKTPDLSASVGSYAAATSTWTAPNTTTNSFTLTNNETSGNNNIESIVVTFVPNCQNVSAPTDLACSSTKTSSQLTFTWTGAEHASAYIVKLWDNSECTGDPVASDVNVTGTSKTFSGLDASTIYYCKVQSKGDGTTYCAEGGITDAVSGTTDDPTGYVITKSATNGTITTEVSGVAVKSAEENAQVDIEAIPATGYEFTSWSIYETATPGNTIDPHEAAASTYFTMPAAAVTVSAAFNAINYDVDYTAPTNGSYIIKVGGADAVSANTTAQYGQTITLAATPVSSAYYFAGWTVTGAVSGSIEVTENTFEMPAENVTIEAAFSANNTITYNANDGTGSMDPTVDHGAITLRPNTFTKAGYVFAGWATSQANANLGTIAYGDGAAYTLNADAELFAVWYTPYYTFTPATTGDAPAIDAAISSSVGGEMTYTPTDATTGQITYTTSGLQFGNGSTCAATVTTTNAITEGSVIIATIYNNTTTKTRGLKLCTTGSNTDLTSGAWSWQLPSGKSEETKVCSYIVNSSSALKNATSFRLLRNNTVYLQKLVVAKFVAPAATHTLTWNFDEGNCSATAGVDYTAGGQVEEGATIIYPAASTMSREGKDFNGWSTSATTMPTSDLAITAQWVDHVTSTDATLSALSVAGCTLNETFDPETEDYTVDLPFYGVMPVAGDVTATKNDEHAETPAVSISGNVITVHCVAESGAEKDYTVTVTIAPAPTASSSINIEQLILDNSRAYNIGDALDAAHIGYTNKNDLDSLKPVSEKADRNLPYLGLKFKSSSSTITIIVPAGETLKVKFGDRKTAVQVAINDGAAAAATITDDVYSLTATSAVRQVKFSVTENNKTIVLKQVMVGEDIKTVNLPWKVTYTVGANGTCATASAVWTGTALNLPAVTPNSGWIFNGWFTAATEGSKVGDAGAEYTPTADVELFAQYTAQASPYDLMVLTYQIGTGAATAVGYEDGKFTYNIELPYAPSYDAITVAPTLKVGTSYLKGDEVLTVSSLPGAATFTVVEEGGASEQLYTVNFSKQPKDAACLIWGDVANNSLTRNAAKSQLNGTLVNSNVRDNAVALDELEGPKFQTNGYLSIALEGQDIKAGDQVAVFVTSLNGLADKLRVFNANEAIDANVVAISAENMTTRVNKVTMTEDASTIYLRRGNDYSSWNPCVAYVAVYRAYPNPLVSNIEINSITLDVNNTASPKTITGVMPSATDFGALSVTSVTFLSNDPANTNGVLDGAWNALTEQYEGTYTVTDKDGDQTIYNVTLTEDVAVASVTISGETTVSAKSQITLTATVLPAGVANKNVTWTSSDETKATVDANGVVTGKAAGNVTITATSVADGTKFGTQNITVTKFVGTEYAYWFAKAADATPYGITNDDGTIFESAPTDGSNLSASLTMEVNGVETTYDVTRRSGDVAFGTFHVPADFTANLHMLVAGSGDGRVLRIKETTTEAYQESESFGGSAVTVVFSNLQPGDYTFEKVGGNIRVALMVAELNSYPLTSVSIESGFNLRVSTSRTPTITLNPSKAAVASQTWTEVSRTGASDATFNTTTGVITAGTEEGTITVKVSVTDAFGNTVESGNCVVNIVNIIDQQPVTGSVSWNWSGAAAADVAVDQDISLVLANYLSGDNWDKLKGTHADYAYNTNNGGCYQSKGTLSFTTTVPGLVTIRARRISNNANLKLGAEVLGELTSTVQTFGPYAVKPGEVNIVADATEGMRILSLEFNVSMLPQDAEASGFGGYERTVTEGRFGTICLPNGGVMVGADIFEVAYMDYQAGHPYKIYFDEVLNGEMVAGRPYVFLPQVGATQLGVFYTDALNADAGNYKGLYGSYTRIKVPMNDGNYILLNNQYYFVDTDNVYCGANKAYIKLADVPQHDPGMPAYGRRRISMGVNSESTATAIDELNASETPVKIMIDGTMYILRGEKMYDATGRLVK